MTKRKQPPNPSLMRVAKQLAVAAAQIGPAPCDDCWQKTSCAASGYECKIFKDWCQRGTTKEEK